MGFLNIKTFLGVLFTCVFLSSISYAQPPGRMFNPQTVETVSGEVVKVERISHGGWMGHGLHLILKTSEGETSIHLGPARYRSQQGLTVAQNDNLKVTGSKVTQNNQTFIIASKVEKEGKTFVLRDEYGIPMWSGRYQQPLK